jgi:NADPH2:quinone reductase
LTGIFTLPLLNAKREALLKSAADLFQVVSSGKVKIPVNQKYPLKDAQKAHRDLEGRKTTGSIILVP